MADKMIWTEEAVKIYNRRRPDEMTALAGVSIEIMQGEMTVLKGPSGSGKTSLLSLVGCMSRPTSGRVVVQGKDVAKLPERFLTSIRRKTFGFIFQQFNLVRDLSAADNVALPFYPMENGIAEIKERVDDMLARFNLTEKKRAAIKQLSGGEQQRVAIARALINNPEIIIADEPTAHLDRKLSEELLQCLDDLRKEGKTVVIATHDPLIFEHEAVDRTYTMRNGHVEHLSIRQS